MKRLTLTIIATLIFVFVSNAQNNGKTNNGVNTLINTWYESPHDSKGDVIVFKTTQYVNVPGVDVIGMEYSKLTLGKANACELDFSKWCSNHQNHLKGSWNNTAPNKIVLNFGNDGCPSELTVISVTANELKVTVKELK